MSSITQSSSSLSLQNEINNNNNNNSSNTTNTNIRKRDIHSLQTLSLQVIARYPSKCCSSDEVVENALKIIPNNKKDNFDFTQIIIDYITEAGRLADDVLPISIYDNKRTKLCLKNTKITGKYISKVLDKCSNLQVIDMQGTFHVDDDVVLEILTKCKTLKEINLRNCRKLTDHTLNHLMTYGKSLIIIDISGAYNMTRNAINYFLSNFSNISSIQKLNIAGLPIDNYTLESLNKCNSLTSLSLAYADVDETALRTCLNKIGNRLDNLNISWIATNSGTTCYPLSTDFFVEFLALACPRLIELDVCGLKNANASTLLRFLDFKLTQVYSYIHTYIYIYINIMQNIN